MLFRRYALTVLCLVFTLLISVGVFAQEEFTPEFDRDRPQHLTDVTVAAFSEAPMLAELVEAGELPPVEERLPENPVVVGVLESIGDYGGTWRTSWIDWPLWWLMALQMNYADVIRQVGGNTGEFEPDLAERWEVSEDQTQYTFYLREGLKWSDGEPFTTEDIVFWYEDVLLNEELTPNPPGFFTVGGKIGIVEAVDDTTFTVTFSEPNALFLLNLASGPQHIGGTGFDWVKYPKHYLTQFHPNYTSESDLQARVEAAGVPTWVDLFNQQLQPQLTADKPWMWAWIPEAPAAEDGTQIWVRNPYYYKVDEAGNQLPYIDRVRYELTPDAEVVVLNAIAGEYDYYTVLLSANHVAALRDAEQRGVPIRVQPSLNQKTEITLIFNQTTSDPVLRELFQDVRFRQAVSLAVNRQEIVDAEFFGGAEGVQMAYPPGDPFLYDSEWAYTYTEYDPDRANALLDELGLQERDADGFRLRPDGQRLRIDFDYLSRKYPAAMELIQSHLADVGIELNMRGATDALSYERTSTNDVHLSSHAFEPSFFYVEQLLPAIPTRSWAIEWERWLTSDGAEGEEPPEEIQRLWEVVNDSVTAGSIEERVALLQEAGRIHAENLYVIGIAGNNFRPGVVHDRMRNVMVDPAPVYGVGHPPGAHQMYSEQFFIRENYPAVE